MLTMVAIHRADHVSPRPPRPEAPADVRRGVLVGTAGRARDRAPSVLVDSVRGPSSGSPRVGISGARVTASDSRPSNRRKWQRYMVGSGQKTSTGRMPRPGGTPPSGRRVVAVLGLVVVAVNLSQRRRPGRRATAAAAVSLYVDPSRIGQQRRIAGGAVPVDPGGPGRGHPGHDDQPGPRHLLRDAGHDARRPARRADHRQGSGDRQGPLRSVPRHRVRPVPGAQHRPQPLRLRRLHHRRPGEPGQHAVPDRPGHHRRVQEQRAGSGRRTAGWSTSVPRTTCATSPG